MPTLTHVVMNRLIAPAPYAEDQSSSYVILIAHVLHRGASIGAGLGLVIGPAYSRFISKQPVSLLGSAGKGVVYGTLVTAASLVARMWGREEIEWQDRAWRLLGNRGQNEVDEWSFGGMAVGAGVGLARRRVVGGAGMGGLAGMTGLTGWRLVNGEEVAARDV